MADVRRAADALTRRDPAAIGRTERHRRVARNAMVMAGTRIPVQAIRRFLDAGYSAEAIVAEYPALTAADVSAVAAGATEAA